VYEQFTIPKLLAVLRMLLFDKEGSKSLNLCTMQHSKNHGLVDSILVSFLMSLAAVDFCFLMLMISEHWSHREIQEGPLFLVCVPNLLNLLNMLS
jgi:hypothetical protein